MQLLRRALAVVPRLVVLSAAVLAIGLALAMPAYGQADPAAEQLFQEGNALMDEGKHGEACVKFEASMKLEPAAGTALNLGRCNAEQGKTATAWAAFKRAAALFRARGEADRERFARDRAAELEAGLSRITIEAPTIEALVVRQNDAEIPQAVLGSAIPVDPGEHRIEASAAGYESWSTTVTVGAEGDAQVVTIPALRRAPVEPSNRPTTVPSPSGEAAQPAQGSDGLLIGGAVLLGVGTVAAVVGGALGGIVLSDASEAEEDEALCGADKLCTAAGLEHIEGAEEIALAANVLIGVGAAVAVGGLVMLLVSGSSDAEAAASGATAWPRPTVTVGPTGAGLGLVGAF